MRGPCRRFGRCSVAVLLAAAVCSTLTACGGTSYEDSRLVAHSVTWAPDGKLLAFVGWDGLYVVTPTGEGLRRVVEGDANDPTWAPSRQELALTALQRPGGNSTGSFSEIKVVDLATLEIRNLSRSPADDVDPAWSPDGERVAFSSNRAGNYDLYTVRRDGRQLRRLTRTPARESEPAWSPDGRTIVFRREGGSRVPFSDGTESVVQISADGTRERVLLSIDPRETFNRCCRSSAWSHDGRKVAVDLGASVRIIDVAGGGSTVVARRGVFPLWSPDDTHLLFEGWEPRDCSGQAGICIPRDVTGPWVVRADGSHTFSVVKQNKLPSVVTVGSSWSPNGRSIALVVDVVGDRSLVIVDAHGSGYRRLNLVEGRGG